MRPLLLVSAIALVVAGLFLAFYSFRDEEKTVRTVTEVPAPVVVEPTTPTTPTEPEPTPEPVPEPVEEPASRENSVEVDLSKASVSWEEGIKTGISMKKYDINVTVDGGYVLYGLGTEDEGKFVVMFQSPDLRAIRISWDKDYLPVEQPDDLCMTMKANGEPLPGDPRWFVLPIEVLDQNKFTLYYE